MKQYTTYYLHIKSDCDAKTAVVGAMEKMKMRSNYFKIVCWIFACAFVLTGCSDRYAEEKISAEDEREESEEKKVEQTETELNSISSEAEAEG